MFTGIVEAQGRVRSARAHEGILELAIRAPEIARGLRRGDSVAVNGVCLTARAIGRGRFEADVMHETLARTTLGLLRRGEAVNLELAARLSDRLGGHLVQGHVDCIGTVAEVNEEGGNTRRIELSVPAEVLRYVVPKGSVAIDGVSLTVAGLTRQGFEVALIPHTLEVTSLGRLVAGSMVNIEVDVIGKYIERLMEGN